MLKIMLLVCFGQKIELYKQPHLVPQVLLIINIIITEVVQSRIQ